MEVSILPTRRFSLFFAALPAIAGENAVGRARRVSTVVKLSYCPAGRFTGTGEPTPFVSRTAPLPKRFDPLVVLWLARTQITQRYSIVAKCAYIHTHIYTCIFFHCPVATNAYQCILLLSVARSCKIVLAIKTTILRNE